MIPKDPISTLMELIQIPSPTNQMGIAIWRDPFDISIQALSGKIEDISGTEIEKTSGFIMMPFPEKQKGYRILPQKKYKLPLQNNPLGKPINPHTNLDNILKPCPKTQDSTQKTYLNMSEIALQLIQEENLKKVVLAQKQKIPFPHAGLNIIPKWIRLVQKHKHAFVYLFLSHHICWMGASPELLLSLSGQRIQTHAIAGTHLLKKDKLPHWNDKEKREQDLVSKHLKKELKTFVSQLEIQGPESYPAGEVVHIRSTLKGQLKTPHELNLNKLIHALHPSPAICGLPRSTARDFIHQYEDFEREFYTGLVGWIRKEKQELSLYVNIRCAQIFSQTVHIYSGAGIVEGSQPLAEWKETQEKTKTLKSIFYPHT
ncbi:MAG: chorismate-binding protein [Cytophagales bacterium]|nr:chorismate-binding protein [Cytophagales bacterium]